MPQLDFDVITMGHGSGGLLTNKLLESGIFAMLNNEWLAERHDGSIVALPANSRTAFSTDSYVIHPIFFPGGDIGELAVNGTVNDLAMCGAKAEYLSLAFILEEGLPMADLWKILGSIRVAADRAGVKIITGDTKVVERGKGDQIFINTSGLGTVHPRAQIGTRAVVPGDVILVSGPLAAHGIAIMSVRAGLTFETTIQSDTQPLQRPVLQLLDEFGEAIHLLRDPTRGGVATVLNEIARDTGYGMDLQQKDLPIAEEVAGACELLGLDPLYVANEGVFLLWVAAEVADAVLDRLQALEGCAGAQAIGRVVEDHPRQVLLQSKIGGKRVVQMLPGEQLPRIC